MLSFMYACTIIYTGTDSHMPLHAEDPPIYVHTYPEWYLHKKPKTYSLNRDRTLYSIIGTLPIYMDPLHVSSPGTKPSLDQFCPTLTFATFIPPWLSSYIGYIQYQPPHVPVEYLLLVGETPQAQAAKIRVQGAKFRASISASLSGML